MSLQDKLEQARIRRKAIFDDIESLRANEAEADSIIKGIEREIADAEVTYSIGDRFKHSGEERMLICINSEILMLNMQTGTQSNSISKVGDRRKITKQEFSTLGCLAAYTRTWDSRKKCKC
jgi:hypothetical protein